MKKILVLLAVVLAALGLVGCGNNLEDGTYSLESISINNVVITSTNQHYNDLRAMAWTIVVNDNTMTIRSGNQVVMAGAQIRVRGGYLESRHPDQNDNRWSRANGSAASDFTSLRVENGNIVFRFTAGSVMSQLLGGPIMFVYALPVTTA